MEARIKSKDQKNKYINYLQNRELVTSVLRRGHLSERKRKLH